MAGKCRVIWSVLIIAHREFRDPDRAKFTRKFANTKPFMPELRFETLPIKLAVESSFVIYGITLNLYEDLNMSISFPVSNEVKYEVLRT